MAMRFLLLFLFFAPFCLKSQKIDPKGIQIARDRWGTPHIFAKTDAEVAYGLAWANCEDNFFEMQESLAAGQGRVGRLRGKDGAAIDYVLQAIGVRDSIAKYWPGGFSPAYRLYAEGYCQGLNAYAAAHPEQVRLRGSFPVKVEEILGAYLASGVLFVGYASELRALYAKPEKAAPAKGSNAYAMLPSRTADGRTYFCGNPHFMVQGNFSFYEAHLCSEQGMNIVGALFMGAHSIALGCTPNLAWSHTWNHFDATDSWKLEMHPTQKRTYRYDGQWLRLSRKTCKMKLKIGFLPITVRKKAYASVYGPVFKIKKKGWYAVQTTALAGVRIGQQGYEMNRATNFAEFKAAMEKQQLPMFHTVYADRESNIFYMSNARYPVRNPNFDFSQTVRGDTSATRWQGIVPLDGLPHALNPPCGFVYNTNNSPYLSACEPVKPQLPASFDLRPGQNNRATRFRELVDAHQGTFTFDAFKKLKYDRMYSPECLARQALKPLLALPDARYPDLSRALNCLRRWDGNADPSNREAALVGLSMDYVFEKKGYGDEAFINGIDVDTSLLVSGLRFGQQYLLSRFGKIEVPVDTVFRFHKNGKSYATSGFADALQATYAKKDKNGEYKVMYGDSYIFFAAFDKAPLEFVETLLPYGNSVGSTRYESQLDLYNKAEHKPMYFDKARILRDAVKVYAPE